MIEQARNEYRGWAKRARSLQPVLLVTTAEDLMESEHAAWIDRMTKTIREAPSPPAGPP